MPPRIPTGSVIGPPKRRRFVRRRVLVPLPIMNHRRQVPQLGGYTAAAVGVDGGDRRHVTAVFAESAEIDGVQKLDSQIQLPEKATADQVLQNVLLLETGGVVFLGVPGVEEGGGLVVGSDHVEPGVDPVRFGPLIASEFVGADLQVQGLWWG